MTVVAAAATDVTMSVVLSVLLGQWCWLGMAPPSLHLVDCCTLRHSMTMLVPQAHLPVSWLARERLLMAAWAVMTTDIITAENGGESPFHF